MKKIIKLITVVLTLHTMLNAAVIEKTYYFDHYKVKELGDYQVINFKGTLQTGRVGEPTLPYHSVSLLLPPGEVIESVNIIHTNETEITGQFQLYPKQPVRKISMGKSGKFIKNMQVYSTDAEYPTSIINKAKTMFMNGYSFAVSTFTPLKYNPVKGKATFFKEITIQIHTKPGSNSILENLSSSYRVIKRVKNFAQNPELIFQYPQKNKSPDDYQMLIVTPSMFENEYQDLIDLYLVRGIKTKVVTQEFINSSALGLDVQLKIRNYIIQEYQNHGIEYVLLGGDTELIPHRGFHAVVESGGRLVVDNGIPADLYYSALDGSWNDNHNELWGEIGEDDLLPEISIARFTINNHADLTIMLHKTISYQDMPVTGELQSPLLAAELLWSNPVTWGGDYLDLLIGHKEDNGYITDGIPVEHDIKKLYDRENGHWNSDDLIQLINEGYSFLHHDGHSNFTYNMRMYSSQITNNNFSMVNGVNHNYIPVYTNGCNCGGFDYDDCIGERMVNIDNFAVAFIGNSRSGWFNEGTTEGPGIHLHREFTDALYGNRSGRIGDAHLESKIDTAPWVNALDQYEEGAIRWNFYACNVLGDPAMSIWTDEPIAVQADYPQSVSVDMASFKVNVRNCSNPAEGLNCVLFKDGVLYGVGTTDVAGNAEIGYEPTLITEGEAELIISGYNCLPTSFPINIITDVNFDDKYALAPSTTELLSNYPNPFNPTTTIAFQLHRESKVRLKIYNSSGEKIKSLKFGHQNHGTYTLQWDGTNDKGQRVASGIYICRLEVNNKFETKKMCLLR